MKSHVSIFVTLYGIFSIHVTHCTGGGTHWPPDNIHRSKPGHGNKTGDNAIPPSSGNLSTSSSGSTGPILPECTGESKGEDAKGGACSNGDPIEDLTLDRIEVVSLGEDGENAEDVEEGQNNEEKTENYTEKIIHSGSHSNVSHIRERTTDEPNIIEIKSALLRDYNGVKVTGPCKAIFQMFLVPHITVNVETNKNSITLGPKLVQAHKKERVTNDGVNVYTEHVGKGLMFEKEEKKLLNKCADGKSFKFVLFIDGNKLTVKWKVYDATETENSNKQVDVRTYLMKSVDRPFTSIQIHSASINTSTFLLESKNYTLKKDFPDQCDAIASNCFMSGNVDIEKCYHCTLLLENTDTSNVCFNYVSPEVKERFKEIKINAQEEEDSLEVELKQSIETILEEISKQKVANNRTENLNYNLSDFLKREIVKYCQMLKEADTTGVFEYVQMGNETEIFYNLTNLLKRHEDEMDFLLQRKMRNAAICMKNADEWVTRKMGLILPQLPKNNMEYTNGTYYSEDKERETHEGNYDDTVDLETVANSDMASSHFVEKMFCNEEYCDRWKDKNGCFSKIGAPDQGNCATSWIFASKMHLETIKCMKGYDHVASSALYVANCSEKDAKEKCTVGSNPLEFLHIVDGKQFLPAEANLQYSYAKVSDDCPKPKSNWVNLWTGIKLLDYVPTPNSVGTKGYTAYESAKFKGNMDSFIKKVKSEIKNKGSVIAYVRAENALSYDMNGGKIHKLCGSETPDHAVNIVGYGNYVSSDGKKKSYWTVRNSWGENWGDNGNFKVDMDTPTECKNNFIHTAAVFNLDLPIVEKPVKAEAELYNYYLKSSPDLYSNLYYSIYSKVAAENGTAYGHADGNETVGVGSVAGGESYVEAGNTASYVAGREGGVPGQKSSSSSSAATAATGEEKAGLSGSAVGKKTEETPMQPVGEPDSPTSDNVEVLHMLKNVKNNKVKISLVTYETSKAITADHVCSRAYSEDPDKLEECAQFCESNWNDCANKISPGYCLTLKRKTNDCFFCYV
ncbi:serine-repeat antigen, putative [Plasmodium ovale]|uniref:Serine-repeat antigen, putative n=1 Tax=Plasmodium ovale TaxID=36330 RepID=A0A1C3KNV7_PLAOA|nr:serine-repeat antigen, putative [Plasmodium ovale]